MHRKHTQLSIEKSEARGSRGMAATKHPLASAVAVEVLANGGSAADAAVAASFAVTPASSLELPTPDLACLLQELEAMRSRW